MKNQIFKNFFLAVLFFPIFSGCDDGEVIVTSFDFNNYELRSCGTAENLVFYKVNPQVFQSISLKLSTPDNLYSSEGIKEFGLNGSSVYANYRTYDGPLGNNYFCSSVPPISPKVETDYKASSGTAELLITFHYDDPYTIRKSVKVILLDAVFENGENRIIQDTLDLGTIENAETVDLNP